MNFPKVAIIGRTNVGKSTLFNKLIAENVALVSSIAGTTRDRNIKTCEWNGYTFELIDTGGLDISYLPENIMSKDLLQKKHFLLEIERDIVRQTQIAIRQADLILFVIDAQIGILQEDRSVLNFLRKHKKAFLLVANKVDNQLVRKESAELVKLGAGTPFLVSAATGVGSGDLLDEVVKHIKKRVVKKENEVIGISILGKPNVGKSSLLNFLAGEERVIVNPMPHTTRESQDIFLMHQKKHLRIIDTAGIRRQAKVSGFLEREGIERSFESLAKTDVALLMLEVNQPLTSQDGKIAHEISQSKTSVIIIANKWDLISEKDTRTQKIYQETVQKFFPDLKWAPIIFMSAKTGSRAKKVLDLILEVNEYRYHKIEDEELAEFIKKIITKHSPKKRIGIHHPKIYGMEQRGINPPRFHLFVDDKRNIHPSYIRYIQNQLYAQYKFYGAPLIIELKSVK